MQGDQRHSFKSQNSQHLPKKEIHSCRNWHVTAWPKKKRHNRLELQSTAQLINKRLKGCLKIYSRHG